MPIFQKPPRPAALDRVQCEALMQRYPDISHDELQALVHFMKHPSHADYGWLHSDPDVQPIKQRIRREHEGLFVNRRRDIMVLTAIMLSLLVICWLLWDTGLH